VASKRNHDWMDMKWALFGAVLGFVVAASWLGDATRLVPRPETTETRPSPGEARKQPESFWQKTTSDPAAFFTLWVALFAAGLTASTAGLWTVTHRALRHAREDAARHAADMQASVDLAKRAAEAAQRSAEATERGLLTAGRAWVEIDVALAGNLIFDSETVSIRARAIAKNVGNAPAANVALFLRLFTDASAASTASEEVSKADGSAAPASLELGQVLFPGREASAQERINIPRESFLARIKEVDAVEPPTGEQWVPFTHMRPAIMAYAQYRLPGEGPAGGYHYSTAIFEVASRIDGHPGFDGNPMVLARTDLELVATSFSGKNT